MTLNDLNDFLRGKTLMDGGLCYGTIFHFTFPGGALETAGSGWKLTDRGTVVETSDDDDTPITVAVLEGQTIRELNFLSPDRCKLTFWEDIVLECWNAAHEDYEMGTDMLCFYRDEPDGTKLFCDLSAPLGTLEWKDARKFPAFENTGSAHDKRIDAMTMEEFEAYLEAEAAAIKATRE